MKVEDTIVEAFGARDNIRDGPALAAAHPVRDSRRE
jgi:hypothetical protein